MLQRLGCTLPIEFWALGNHDWTPEMERLAREELRVDDCRLPRAEDDPAFLFDSEQLAEHGAIFWPDPTPIGPEREVWEIMGVGYREVLKLLTCPFVRARVPLYVYVSY